MPGCRPLLFAALVLLGGCASGIEPGGNFPSVTFDVATPYDAAYRRGGEFARTCHTAPEHPYGVEYRDVGTLDEKFAVGRIVVFKVPEPAVHLEVMEFKPKGKTDSTVTVTVVGRDGWDARELEAAQRSIQTATPVCRAAG
ncbi:Lipoprotein [Bordetella sputigena]|uniref:BPTD_2524 family lipoprotein n=1 Tax=Bordetella sputigena TaxID=1416810 RepID=UPI0039EFBDB0